MSHPQRIEVNRRRRRARRQQRHRRGILLLVTLSLLILFLMVGTAFLITAKQSGKQAKALASSAATYAANREQAVLLDEVALQIIRGTTNSYSSLQAHSLLEDMYGLDGFTSTIPPGADDLQGSENLLANKPGLLGSLRVLPNLNAQNPWPIPYPNSVSYPPPGGNGKTAQYTVRWPDNALSGSDYRADVTHGQILEIDLVAFEDLYGNPGTAADRLVADNAYAGQVLTFLSGPAEGVSTRIVGSRHQGNWLTLQLMAFRLPDGTNLHVLNNGVGDNQHLYDLLVGQGPTRVLVNGRPFNGTGAGFDPTSQINTPRLAMSENLNGLFRSLVLLPNTSHFDTQRVRTDPSVLSYVNPPNTGREYTYFGEAANSLLPDQTPNPRFNPQMRLPFAGAGGGDESYDAPDFQNMFLAFLPADRDLVEVGDPANSTLGSMPLPSFHRPELVNYWDNIEPLDVANSPAARMLLRRVMLRPNWLDHPNFTGSNPNLVTALETWNGGAGDAAALPVLLNHAVYGPWDVDNDGDGVRDSVWVDFGAPVMTDARGRLVKPMAAVLCLDMDGRVSVNAADSLDLAGANPASMNVNAGGPSKRLAEKRTITSMPRGLGYGPADISLREVLGNAVETLFKGQNQVPGRYGIDLPGAAVRGLPGHVDGEVMMQLEQPGWPRSATDVSLFASPPDLSARYGVGLNTLGQPISESGWDDRSGAGLTQTFASDMPYEIDLSAESGRAAGDRAADAPFGIAELERVLRAYDGDAVSLEDRLFRLAGVGSNLRSRLQITTDSNDLPSPSFALPPHLESLLQPGPLSLAGARRPSSVADLIELRVRVALGLPLAPAPLPGVVDPSDGANTPIEVVASTVRRLLAPELAAGLPLDLNRPFGNGSDDNNNGIVDEPAYPAIPNVRGAIGEGLITNSMAWQVMSDELQRDVNGGTLPPITPMSRNPRDTAKSQFGRVPYAPLDADGSGVIDANDDLLQRQLLARHLYVLALGLTARAQFFDGMANDEDRLLAQRIAQWAVNVVDFRDQDSIMTGFEFDMNPFDGWGVDGNLATNDKANEPAYGVDPTAAATVWGCERPELVMTETLAWHDRRTSDEGDEQLFPSGSKEGFAYGNNPEDDSDFDQKVRPRGAFFVELYNPTGSLPGASLDTRMRRNVGMDQNRRAQFGPDLGVNIAAEYESPVWRMTIYKRGHVRDPQQRTLPRIALWDPDSPYEMDNVPDETTPFRPPVPPDRSVYFGNRDPGLPDDGIAFFRNPRTRPPQVRPGRYLIVGSGEDQGNGKFEVPIADRFPIPGAQQPQGQNNRKLPTRRIVLDANPGAANKVLLTDRSGSTIEVPVDSNRATKTVRVEAPAEDRNAPNTVGSTLGTCMADVMIIDQVSHEFDPAVDFGGSFKDPAQARQFMRRYDVTGTRTQRLTLTEPATGYIFNFKGSRWNDTEGFYEAVEQPGTALPIDIPLDGRLGVTTLGAMHDIIRDREELIKGTYTFEDEYELDLLFPQGIDPALVTMDRMYEGTGNDDPRANYAVIYLQRLANPLLAWNPEPGRQGHNPNLPVNPYRTVDSISSNLTVYNSRTEEEQGEPANLMATHFKSFERFQPIWRDGRDDDINQPNRLKLKDVKPSLAHQPPIPERGNVPPSMQRALKKVLRTDFVLSKNDPNAKSDFRLRDRELQSQVRAYRRTNAGSKALDDGGYYFFKDYPQCSLGHLYGPCQMQMATSPNVPQMDTNSRGEPTSPVEPTVPLEWITWNDRPYVSANELLLVPRTRSSRLFHELTTAEYVLDPERDAFNTPGDLQDHADYAGVPRPSPYLQTLGEGPLPNNLRARPPFAHLENFFYSTADLTTVPEGAPANFYRVLEFVGTRPLYTGTEELLNPVSFTLRVDPTNPEPFAGRFDPRYQKLAPFNRVSSYRTPGQINLNTIASDNVWQSLFHGRPQRNVAPRSANTQATVPQSHVHRGPRWDEGDAVVGEHAGMNRVRSRMVQHRNPSFIESRRGTNGDPDDPLLLDPNFPTFFANPFRSSGAADLVPTESMRRLYDVDCTLLRSNDFDQRFQLGAVQDNPEPDPQPLFAATIDVPGRSDPMSTTALPANDPSGPYPVPAVNPLRNAFFRYQPIIRLNNLTTNRSNVYAIWITIGFFEVQPAPPLEEFVQANDIGSWNADQQLELYNRVYPEGYQLSREAGSETGDLRRLKGFYMVDRTIPVGFEPGKDHNVERAIRLRRRIQ
jgi:hypothetical protein